MFQVVRFPVSFKISYIRFYKRAISFDRMMFATEKAPKTEPVSLRKIYKMVLVFSKAQSRFTSKNLYSAKNVRPKEEWPRDLALLATVSVAFVNTFRQFLYLSYYCDVIILHPQLL